MLCTFEEKSLPRGLLIYKNQSINRYQKLSNHGTKINNEHLAMHLTTKDENHFYGEEQMQLCDTFVDTSSFSHIKRLCKWEHDSRVVLSETPPEKWGVDLSPTILALG